MIARKRWVAVLLLAVCFPAVVGVFDLGWKYGERAFRKCKKRGETAAMKGMCANLQEVVEDAFDDQGGALQTAFGNAYSDANDMALKEPFFSMGEKLLDNTIKWMFDKKINKKQALKDEFIQRFFKWFSEVLKEVDRPGSASKQVELPEGFEWAPGAGGY
eukprot:TRINITY_DN31204_c0_g1_i1.p2 TRINITY_DN31204_c0_g1~~TRINITY_DN31204_c0_g1_i1.p2  ORF type:complete len:160 (-),score=44.86 TRINITY_DN31204_c0_g1_i1:72-551(-)